MEAAPGFEPAARGGQSADNTGTDRAQLMDIEQVELGGTGQLGDTAGHLEDRSGNCPCSADVPHLPTDLPDVVLHGLRHWSQLNSSHATTPLRVTNVRLAAYVSTRFRYKRVSGERLRARNFEAQKREAMIAVNVLNRMTELGGHSPR